MAAANGRTGAAVIGQLFREPYRFDFFQAVRLLDSHARREAEMRRRFSVGHDAAPVQEIVRFRVPASLSFAAASIVTLAAPDGEAAERTGPPEMTVPFLGLTGPSGVLPQHYTALRALPCQTQGLRAPGILRPLSSPADLALLSGLGKKPFPVRLRARAARKAGRA
jgi:predicted component of type VI protein secretion system